MRLPAIKAFVIPHNQQRYNTVGDYWSVHPGRDDYRISDLGNSDYEFLILIHELIEAHLTRKHEINWSDITAFDLAFDSDPTKSGEPGTEPDAPYHKEHMFATWIEKQVAAELQISWDDYEATCDALITKYTSLLEGKSEIERSSSNPV